MPKSRNRPGHKKAAQSYKKRTENEKKAFQNKMRALFDQQQQEALAQQTNGEVAHEEVEGLNLEDFQLDDESVGIVPELVNLGIVEGVTSPDQL